MKNYNVRCHDCNVATDADDVIRVTEWVDNEINPGWITPIKVYVCKNCFEKRKEEYKKRRRIKK